MAFIDPLSAVLPCALKTNENANAKSSSETVGHEESSYSSVHPTHATIMGSVPPTPSQISRATSPTQAPPHPETHYQSFIETYFDRWYAKVAHLTFDSQTIPLTRNDAEALQRNIVRMRHGEAPNLQELQPIAEQLTPLIATYGGSVFVKLSGRSPKDAVTDRIAVLFEKSLLATANPDVLNTRIIAAEHAKIESLKITSPEEALVLLLSSDRIATDLQIALREPSPDVSLVVRRWADIPLSGEFRCFVLHGQLRAVSQYYSHCYFPELQNSAHDIAHDAQQFLTSIYAALPDMQGRDLVYDFARMPHGDLKLIEFNVFPTPAESHLATDPLLFQWDELRQPKAEPEVRIVQRPYAKSILGFMESDARALVEGALGRTHNLRTSLQRR